MRITSESPQSMKNKKVAFQKAQTKKNVVGIRRDLLEKLQQLGFEPAEASMRKVLSSKRKKSAAREKVKAIESQ